MILYNGALFFQPTRHPSGLDLVSSPMKKKRKKSLTQAEVLKFISDHKRDLKAAATTIAEECFMKIPVDEIPTQDLEEMEATIEKMRAKIGKFMWAEMYFTKLESGLDLIFSFVR